VNASIFRHPTYRIGIERLRQQPALAKDWGRCGLVSNQASVSFCLEPSWAILQEILGDQLGALFGPQHGFESTVQDNMIETGHGKHLPTGLPVFSLYSETREPTEAMVSNLDTIIVDLPVVGCRIYTYKYTLAGCLRAAKKYRKHVVVLDRPNPLGGEVLEGQVLSKDARSFVGEYEIPMRHGLTMGEAANLFNQDIGAQLTTVPMEGWSARSVWAYGERPWVLMSPNMPTLETAYVFPGMVLFEGTNVSEGRGTTLPFQFVGAPWIKDSKGFVKSVQAILGGKTPGVYLREATFQPTNQKWAGKECQGLQIHIVDPHTIRSYRLGLAIVRAVIEAGTDQSFQWRQPPYEYEEKLLPIEILSGRRGVHKKFEDPNFSVNDSYWHDGVKEYISRASKHLLYARNMIVSDQ